MTIPNMVPTVHTRLLAARLIEACERADTTGTDAVHQYLFACKKGQEVALVAAILDQKTGATPPGDVCRNGHLIATKDDLIDNYRGGVTCRECRRETQAAYDRKRAGKPPRDCPRCGCSTFMPALCRDCRGAAS